MKIRKHFIPVFMLIAAAMWSCNDDDSIVSFDADAQLEMEVDLINQYLVENNLTDQVDTVNSNLKYIITEEGDGETPELTDLIYINYKGRLLSTGQEFDSGENVTFRLNGLISGWQMILPNVKTGSKVTMFIPSRYAYGQQATGGIPANSTLIFDIELLDILNSFKTELLSIDEYIDDKELSVQIDDSTNMRYMIVEQGTGDAPVSTSTVNVSFEAVLLDDSKVQKQDSIDVRLPYMIEGWQILMPYINEGGTIMMFIPSEYGYGEQDYENIPGNSSLVYTVTLNEIL